MYQAFVSKVSPRPLPGADRVALGGVANTTVVISKEITGEELGIYFPTDGALHRTFCEANDLYPRFDENKNRIGGGFFDENGRVRAQKFRGEKSDGFWCPLEYLEKWAMYLTENKFTNNSLTDMLSAISSLKEGDLLDSILGESFCTKYMTARTRRAQAESQQNKSKSRKLEFALFHKHMETDNINYYVNSIPEGSLIHISEKEHGTSGRYACLPLPLPDLPTWKTVLLRILVYISKLFGIGQIVRNQENVVVTGTRNVIVFSPDGGFYGTHDFRLNIAKQLEGKMRPNEIVYGEIVGYQGTTPIMSRHSTEKLSDKTFTRTYGKEIVYHYGNDEGNCSFHIYRIVHVHPDGSEIELNFNQMARRATELGFKPVLDLSGYLRYNGDAQDLLRRCEELSQGPSGRTLDYKSKHPKEGVVVRVERPDGSTKFYKYKTFEFRVMEGIAKDTGEEDMEEAS